MHPCLSYLFIYFLSFQLTGLSLSPRSSPLLEHQRASADKTRLCVNRRTHEKRGHIKNKSVSLLQSSPVMVLVNPFIDSPHSSLSPWGHLPGSAKNRSQLRVFYKVSPFWVSSRPHLAGILTYLSATGDQTSTLNIVLHIYALQRGTCIHRGRGGHSL